MSLNESKISMHAVQALLDAVNAHAADLDEQQLPPDGDSYNDLHHLVTKQLTALLDLSLDVSQQSPQEKVAASVQSARKCNHRLLAAKKAGALSTVQTERNNRNEWMASARNAADDFSFMQMLMKGEPSVAIEAASSARERGHEDNVTVARMLKATLDRITLTNFRSLLQASERCTQEQLNGNANSQASADKAMEEIASSAVSQMVISDRQYLESLLTPQT